MARKERRNNMSINIKENVPLAPLTTFKIGGAARYFTEVRSEDDIREALAWARERKTPFVILGGGSNILVADEGLNALVVRIASADFDMSGKMLTADAGCNLTELIRKAGEKGLGRWEKLAGIPGSIGGAVRGNAGAFGTEIKDVAISVRAFNTKTNEAKYFTNTECTFLYRNSFFKKHPEWIILRVVVELHPVAPRESALRSDETITERNRRHLQDVQAAGSYFMNPIASPAVREQFKQEKGVRSREGRVPAGWLIEKAGMKGAVEGGAIASIQHPNYIVNTGHATSADVRALAKRIKAAVLEKFGIRLEEEAIVLDSDTIKKL